MCPIKRTIEIIGKKWTIHIIRSLEKPKGFNRIKEELSITPRTLSMRLKELVDAGIAYKKVDALKPLSIEYGLTKAGVELLHLLKRLDKWATKWKVLISDSGN